MAGRKDVERILTSIERRKQIELILRERKMATPAIDLMKAVTRKRVISNKTPELKKQRLPFEQHSPLIRLTDLKPKKRRK